MKAQEIRTKLEKAQEAVTKKEATLKKYESKEEKIRKQIEAKGWSIEAGRHQKADTAEHQDCYWTMCDYDDVVERIEETKKAIEEKKAIVAKWESKLAEATDKETEQEMYPEILKAYRTQVVAKWDEWDKEKRARLQEAYKELGYDGFIKKHHYNGYEFMHITDEEIHKDNERTADALILNLWNRVKDIVGEATDWSHLFVRQGNEWEGAVVNGLVKGTKGTACVETISAGGYNIQRFHYRTIVTKM